MSYHELARLGLTVRPLDRWPGPRTADTDRVRPPFRAPFGDTVATLAHELKTLDADNIVLQLALRESQLRVDGLPRADARTDDPGVILAFDSKHGPLRYACDRFLGGSTWIPVRERSNEHQRIRDLIPWQVNLRAIALGLEALRKVDRYGISQHGEQYRGYAELPAGIPPQPATHMTTTEAVRFLVDHGKHPSNPDLDDDKIARMLADWKAGDDEPLDRLYRIAARKLHPDGGGSEAEFVRLQAAKDLLLREVQR